MDILLVLKRLLIFNGLTLIITSAKLITHREMACGLLQWGSCERFYSKVVNHFQLIIHKTHCITAKWHAARSNEIVWTVQSNNSGSGHDIWILTSHVVNVAWKSCRTWRHCLTVYFSPAVPSFFFWSRWEDWLAQEYAHKLFRLWKPIFLKSLLLKK